MVSVAILPTSATLLDNQQQQFTATVTGTSNTAVSWEVNGIAGGNSTVGTITSGGVYTAPSTSPNIPITVTAISQASPSSTATAAVAVGSASSSDPLGSVSASSATCPAGGVAGQCWSLTVSCPDVADDQQMLKVSAPSGTPKGTILFGVGNGGTGWYDTFYKQGTTIIQNVLNAGFTAVQINFIGGTQGWLSGPGGPRKLACRYATTANWVFDNPNIHAGGTTAPMCATGNSGGSGAIAYALTHYGLGSIFAMVEPTSGPPFGRVDIGCLCGVSAVTLPPDACGNTISPCYDPGQAQNFLDAAYGNTSCSQKTGSASVFLNDSIESPDANLSYPTTDVHVLYGSSDMSAAVPQGYYWAPTIQSQHTIACVQGAGHGIPDSTAGASQISNDLINFCHH